jgi:hypothetical protein
MSDALNEARYLLVVPCWSLSLQQYAPRVFHEPHEEEIVSLELTISLMLHAQGLTRGEGRSADRLDGLNHWDLLPPRR